MLWKTSSILPLLFVGLPAAFSASKDERINAEKIYIQVPVAMHTGTAMPMLIRAECNLARYVGEETLKRARRLGYWDATPFVKLEEVGSSKALKLTFLSVEGEPGGLITGDKTIVLRADLVQDGKVLGSATFTRTARGGLPAAWWRGTCNILQRNAKKVGALVVRWLPVAMGGMAKPAPLLPDDDDDDEKVAAPREATGGGVKLEDLPLQGGK